MKTSLSLTIFFCLFSIQLITAQASISIETGANRTSIDLKDDNTIPYPIDRDPGVGFYIGVVPKFAIGERLKIAPEVQYSLERNEWSGIYNRFHNIRLIPQIEYKIVKPLSLMAGFNITINAHEEYKNSLDSDAEWITDNDLDLIKTADYGIAGGLRLYVFDRLNLTFKYIHGLNNISNIIFTDDNGVSLDFEDYSQTFQLGIGYSLFNKTS